MQNRYVGDIGDFGKYGLLRFLFRDSTLRLGIHWCLVPDENNNSDGRHIDYLLGKDEKDKRKKSEVFEVCDHELYSALFNIVKPKWQGSAVIGTGTRSVRQIENAKILPARTFNNQELKSDRQCWTNCTFDNCDVIFFDPDNGLPPNSIKDNKNHPKNYKYIYEDEFKRFYDAGKSLIIYNHKDRKKEEECLRRFCSITPKPSLILRWNRISVRYYLFILQKEHKSEIVSRLTEMKKSEWFNSSKQWHKKPNFIIM